MNHEQFHSYANDTEREAQQMAAVPLWGGFLTDTPLERERCLEIQLEQRRRRRQQETPEQREHRLAQRRQHLEIRFIPWKTQIVSLPVKFPADRSKFQF